MEITEEFMYKIDTNDFLLLFEPYIDHGAFGNQFSFLTGGHVHIMGTLYDSHEQELNFSNSIDQTELRKFAKSLYHDLCEV